MAINIVEVLEVQSDFTQAQIISWLERAAYTSWVRSQEEELDLSREEVKALYSRLEENPPVFIEGIKWRSCDGSEIPVEIFVHVAEGSATLWTFDPEGLMSLRKHQSFEGWEESIPGFQKLVHRARQYLSSPSGLNLMTHGISGSRD